jgi:glycosyltransferase involved in cell wall biosynthesis
VKVLHVVPSFAPAWRYGGPVRSLLGLCKALQQSGLEIEVATTNCDGPADLDVPVNSLSSYDGIPVRYFIRWPKVDYAFSPSLSRFLSAEVRRFDLVHITSIFSFPTLTAARTAAKAGVPYLISPRGSLQSYALRQKQWKKWPYWALIERGNLSRAAAVHATSEIERDDVLRILPEAEVFAVANGTDDVPDTGAKARNPRQIVFLGRLHPHKGFDVLVPALARVTREIRDVQTVIAGPDEVGEWSRIERLAASMEPRPRIRYVGPADGPERFRLLAESAVFVLASHGESFGMAVVEAMACGTPVVVSRNCPWRLIEEKGAGAWVENTPEAVAAALVTVLREPERAARMGEAGRTLAAQYSWPSVGRAMSDAYERIVAAYRRRKVHDCG